jgi:hypothetical protein
MLQKGFVPDDVFFFFFNLITVLLPRIVNKIHVTLDNLRAQFHGEMLLSRSIPADKLF